MEPIRVYRNISTQDKLLGLELADGCLLLLVFFLAFMINRNGLFSNIALLLAFYAGLRALKRGKSDGYLLTLMRFVLSPRYRRITGFEEAEPLK